MPSITSATCTSGRISVPHDDIMAYTWMNLAARHYSDREKSKVAENLRDAVALRKTPAEIAKAQK